MLDINMPGCNIITLFTVHTIMEQEIASLISHIKKFIVEIFIVEIIFFS